MTKVDTGLTTAYGRVTDPHTSNTIWQLLPYGTPALTGFSETRFASARVDWVVGSYRADQFRHSPLLATRGGNTT